MSCLELHSREALTELRADDRKTGQTSAFTPGAFAAKRNFKPARTREEALAWLAEQAEKE